MEAEKRKRVDDGKILDSRRSEEKTAIEGAEAVKDEDVEEFFAILRRIQVAVKYFEKNDGKRWKPSFQKEDFEEVNCHVERRRKEEEEDHHLDDSTGLDLNSDPPSEEDSVKH